MIKVNQKLHFPLIIVGTCLAVLIFYCPVTHFPFLYFDDTSFILKNNFLGKFSFDNLVNLWKVGTIDREKLYIPLTYTSYFLESAMFGKNASLMHLNNLLLHIANTFLLILILRRIGVDMLVCFLSVLLFAFHWFQVEPVAWIMGRKDLLSTFFCLCAVYIQLSNTKTTGFIRFPVLLLGAAAMLSKPSAAILPLILIGVEIFKGRALSQSIRMNSVLIVVAVSVYVLNSLNPLAGGIRGSLVFSFFSLSHFAALWFKQFFLLGEAQHLYSYPSETDHFKDMLIAICIIFSTSLFLLKEGICFKKNIIFLGIIIFVSALIPAMIRCLSLHDYIAGNRYFYLPMAGIVIAISGISMSLNKKAKCVFHFGLILFIMLNMLWGYVDMISWSSNVSLWRYELETKPFSARLNYQLGAAYQEEQGRKEEAVYYYRRSMALDPRFDEPMITLGIIYYEQGKLAEASALFNRAIEVGTPLKPQVYSNLAEVYLKMGERIKAADIFRKALSLSPDFEYAKKRLIEIQKMEDSNESLPAPPTLKRPFAEKD